MKKMIVCLAVMFVLATMVMAQITPINATLKAIDTNGVPTFGTSTVTLVGICINSTSFDPARFTYYMQDTGTGWGICLDQSAGVALNPVYVYGDIIKATGTLLNYNGLIELVLTSTTERVGTTTPVTPIVLSSLTSAMIFDSTLATGGEYYEGRLVKINNVTIVSGTWPAAGANANIIIQDAAGTQITMRIDKETDIDGSTQPTGALSIVGIWNQFDSVTPFDSGYQFQPTRLADITAYTPVQDWALY